MEFLLLVIVILVFIVSVLVIGEKILVSSIIRPEKSELKSILNSDQTFPFESRFTVTSDSGIPISFLYIPINNDEISPEKIIVLFHPYNSSAESMRKYVPFFHQCGFSVIIPDARFCGQSGGNHLGLSIVDAADFKSVYDWIKDCLGPNIPIGFFGVSFGAAESILIARSGYVKSLKFIISDSSYSDLYSFIKERVRADYRIKTFPLLSVARLIIKKKYNIDIKGVSPIKDLALCEDLPIFFIHSDNDSFILPQMSIDLYNAKKMGYKKFYLADNSFHGCAFDSDPDTYTDKLIEFFDKINI